MTSRLFSVTFFIFLTITFLSCSQQSAENQQGDFENLPVADIQLISEFDQSGDYFFQHLNYSTETLANGDVLLNDREGAYIIQVTPQGELVRLVAGKGNGPGEVQDPQSMDMLDESTLLIVDQRRLRIIKKSLDSSDIEEFDLPQGDASRVNEAHKTTQPGVVSVHWFDFSIFRNPEARPKTRISSYNYQSDEFISDIRYPGGNNALLRIDGGDPVGSTKVPFTPELLYDYSADNSELYAFWPENSTIAVLDPVKLDTVRAIAVELPSESLTSAERDTLESDYQAEFWPSVEQLLPEQKVPADKMIIGPQNRIWLKLTLQSDQQEWMVLDQSGSPQFRVQFPKEGMVTHISDHHIGFRADDHVFALYNLIE